jgi:uncharacterized damage-inducible protein DinB
LNDQLSPQIVRCLALLSDEDIWWRPNEASNSVGNLVLHLSGNVRQWIISGVGGAADVRHRDKEFSERGPLPRRGLTALLRATVREAGRVLDRVPPDSLGEPFSRQGFAMTRIEAIAHVVEHFAYHTGQIVYFTKSHLGRDLQFTHLPATRKARKAAKISKSRRAAKPKRKR